MRASIQNIKDENARAVRLHTTGDGLSSMLQPNTQSRLDGRAMPIPKPLHPRTHPERFDACQIAIEDKLIELVRQASDMGWHRDEILSAIIEIADNLSLARRDDIALAIETQLLKLMKSKDV